MKHYDQAYFDKWYRASSSRVITPETTRLRAWHALAAAEYVLDRRIRSALDVGCGEGGWGVALKKVRRGLRYVGVDPSEYAIRRYGTRRHLRLGAFGALRQAKVRGTFDLVVCADVLQYVSTPALTPGLQELVTFLDDGVAFLPAYTSDDQMEGDLAGWQWRSPAVWRKAFTAAGLVPLGMHCWMRADRASHLNVFERSR